MQILSANANGTLIAANRYHRNAGGMIAKKALGVHPADVGESGRDADDVEKHNPGKAELDKVYGKVTRNLLPIFFLMITLSYIDRTNLAFASIQLNQDLGFSPEVYGLGSGLFFLGYAAFQVSATATPTRRHAFLLTFLEQPTCVPPSLLHAWLSECLCGCLAEGVCIPLPVSSLIS